VLAPHTPRRGFSLPPRVPPLLPLSPLRRWRLVLEASSSPASCSQAKLLRSPRPTVPWTVAWGRSNGDYGGSDSGHKGSREVGLLLLCVWLLRSVWMGLGHPWITDVWLDGLLGPAKPWIGNIPSDVGFLGS
jgi:hypothetical protein